jgi:hypothetical protein
MKPIGAVVVAHQIARRQELGTHTPLRRAFALRAVAHLRLSLAARRRIVHPLQSRSPRSAPYDLGPGLSPGGSRWGWDFRVSPGFGVKPFVQGMGRRDGARRGRGCSELAVFSPLAPAEAGVQIVGLDLGN